MNDKTDALSPQFRAYWPRVRLFSFLLLAAWFLVTFLTIFFARELADIEVFGWPVSFYMAAQGLALFYLGLIGLYVLRMRRFDRMLRQEKKDGK